MKTKPATSTLQVTDKTRKKIRRRAEKLHSRIMPYVESLLARAMKAEDEESAKQQPEPSAP